MSVLVFISLLSEWLFSATNTQPSAARLSGVLDIFK